MSRQLGIVAGVAAGIPASLAAILMAAERGAFFSQTSLGQELIQGTLALVLAPLMLGASVGLAWGHPVPKWRHGLPVLAGVFAGMLVLGLSNFGPALVSGDGEGNFDAAPAAYGVMALFLATLALGRWWPTDGSAAPLVGLSTLTVASVVWTDHALFKDTSTPGVWWLILAVAAVAVFASPWVRSRLGVRSLLVGVVLAAIALVGVVATSWYATWTSDSIAPFMLLAGTVVLVPAAVVLLDLWLAARELRVAAG